MVIITENNPICDKIAYKKIMVVCELQVFFMTYNKSLNNADLSIADLSIADLSIADLLIARFKIHR